MINGPGDLGGFNEQDPRLRYVPNMLPSPGVPNVVVTLVIHELGVVDVKWSPKHNQWVWLRVLRSFVD